MMEILLVMAALIVIGYLSNKATLQSSKNVTDQYINYYFNSHTLSKQNISE